MFNEILRNNKKNVLGAGIMVIMLFFASYSVIHEINHSLALAQQEPTATFILSSWSYPDEYGQGIEYFTLQRNDTGSWLAWSGNNTYTGFYAYYDYDEESSIEWGLFNSSIRVRVHSYLNSTLVGASSTAEGRAYQRHNVTVYDSQNTIVFSKQNITYSAASVVGDLYYYLYVVDLNFAFVSGGSYRIEVKLEVYYV